MRKLLLPLLALLLVLAGCTSNSTSLGGSFYFTSPGNKTDIAYPADERGTIGALSGPALTGDGTLAITDYVGKVVVINFWGSWCGPCKAEAPDLEAAYDITAGEGVAFLGINVQEPREAGLDFAVSQNVPYPSISDPSMRTMLALKGFPTNTFPATVLVDRQQRVARIFLGKITAQQLTTAIEALEAETP